jgi:hypothetical protein
MSYGDAQVSRDTTPYAMAVNEKWTIPFNRACMWLLDRGVHLTTGDMGNQLRRAQTRVYTAANQEFCVVLSTSALAEGVNLSGLRVLAIGVIVSGRESFLTPTKVLQMIGRLDREDIDGVAMVPLPSMFQRSGPTIKANDVIVDMIGRPVLLDTFNEIRGLCATDMPVTEVEWLTASEVDAMIGTPDVDGVVSRGLKVYREWGLAPYPTYIGIHAYPVAVYRKKYNMVIPTTFARLIRFLAMEDVLPINIFTLPPDKTEALVMLPPAAVILTIILFCRKPRAPRNESLRKSRNSRLVAFVDARIALLKKCDGLFELYGRILNVMNTLSQAMTTSRKEKEKVVGYTWPIYKHDDQVLKTNAAYVVDFLQCTHHLDTLTGIWATYAEHIRGVPMAFDYMVTLLSENVTLPTLHAERHFWRHMKMGTLYANRWDLSLVDYKAAFASMYTPMSDKLHGISINPIQTVDTVRTKTHIPPRCVIENHTLIIGVVAATVLISCLKPEGEPSFGSAHMTLQTAMNRVYTTQTYPTQMGGLLTVSPSAPLKREVAERTQDLRVRGVERYLGVDWWGRLPVTSYEYWDKWFDVLVDDLTAEAASARARYDDMVKKSADG